MPASGQTAPPIPDHAAGDYALGFYARQPVLDRKGAIWGYSLYFRSGLEAAVPPGERQAGATNSVLAALLAAAGPDTGRRLIIKFAAQSLAYELPLLFPAESLVVEVREDLAGDVQALDALRRLKAKGYMIAVSHFSGRPEAALLHELADLLWADALDADAARLAALAGSCGRHAALAGLMRVEGREVHERGLALGFALFQGHYFQEPVTLSTRQLTSSQFSRLKLLQAIEQEAPDFRALAETIRADVALSYKLFGLLNSAHFSLPAPVQSVQQAIALLGWEPLRTWIRLVILTDLTPGKPSELPRSATLRGRFLELCGQSRRAGLGGPASESLFLLGLFSLLPAMLDQSMPAILKTLCLPDEVREALLGRREDCARWLDLAVSFERADWAGVQASLDALGLDPLGVATAYAKATEWTDALFRSVPA